MKPITVTLSPTELANILCSARESSHGIQHWCSHIEVEFGDMTPHGRNLHAIYFAPLTDGAWVLTDALAEDEDGHDAEYRLDRAAIERGVQAIAEKYPHHLAGLAGFEQDARTGDALVQCSIFGEIRYS